MSLLEVACLGAGLAVYQLLNRLLRVLVKRWNAAFYADLKLDPSRKLAPYLVFPLGILLTLVSTPICLSAYTTTPIDADESGTPRPFTTTGKICLASRGVLWASELAPLSYSPEYFAHHVLALSSLLLVLIRNLPRRALYLIYAGLVTELFSDSVALLRLHGRNANNSAAFRRVLLANVVSMVVLRIAPIVVFTAGMRHKSPDFVCAIALYCGYLVRLAFMQLRALGFIESTFQQLLQTCLFGESLKSLMNTSWLPRPRILVAGAAFAIASMSAHEYPTTPNRTHTS
ncbi:hypothetical protein CPLU01_10455 [Colletotrichum plurivorum]|uniref:TLC domain-containing protein n=1 Tax=Colletotrichum plurivorum TaxID=2175906 RepID=A0A8H6N9C2_9PEZI|nr:hypothetical protein CPLU01_10455 [Colletotrichum plurivorum]